MAIKRYLIILLIFILGACSTGKDDDGVSNGEIESRIVIGSYSIFYDESWDKRVLGDFSYAFSYENDAFLYGDIIEDGLENSIKTFVERLPSFRNEFSYLNVDIDYEMGEGKYIRGRVIDKDGNQVPINGYFNGDIFFIYVGDNKITDGLLKKSIGSIEKI